MGSFIKSSSLSEVKKSFVEEKRSLSSMFLESSPSESFIKSSSLSELELQSFVEETKSFCLMIYELAIFLNRYVAIPILYEASLSLKKKSFTNIFFLEKKIQVFRY